ncbi:S1C family serine protease [Candidatus Leptofilum sp.]|uniref:S1C family serine protease n=1 Tax=Candidatus Leptofilum sp. TaxID=3241576 RepID=UPI003B598836
MEEQTRSVTRETDFHFGRLRAQAKAWLRRGWPFAAGIVAAFLGILLYFNLYPNPIPLTDDEVDQVVVNAMASATPPPSYSSQVYQVILPSMVLIRTTGEDADGEEGNGVGSGVIVSANADILTSLHVVAGATEIEIFYADGSESTAVLTAADPENDIAVLTPAQLPEVVVPAVLGNPNAMRVGDEAYAVGNPLGLAGSMSAGVISGFDRTLPINDEFALTGLIQFDTAVNPGNSGGPLLNRRGEVIGIVTALANPSEQNFFIGIGFAVPINTAASAAGAPRY